MDRTAVLAQFNDQMRRDPAAGAGSRIERDDHVTRIVSAGDGWSGVLWSDLPAAAPGAEVDAVIAAQVSRFAGVDGGSGSGFEPAGIFIGVKPAF